MFCTKCGSEILDGTKECPYCGNELSHQDSFNPVQTKEKEAPQWAKTCALIAFIASVVLAISYGIVYLIVVLLIADDYLLISEYFKPGVYIFPLVFALLTLVLGIIYGKRAKAVKCTVAGIILIISSLFSILFISLMKNTLNKEFASAREEFTTTFYQIAGNIPVEYDSKCIYQMASDGEYPAYSYYKFKGAVDIDQFEAYQIRPWKVLLKTNFIIYRLIYNLTTREYDDIKANSLYAVMFYSTKSHSMIVLITDSLNNFSLNFNF